MQYFWSDLWQTLARTIIWTIVSWMAGLGIGYGLYRYSWVNRITLPIVNFLRHISPFCWLPLIIMISGIGEISVGLVLLLAMLFNAILLSSEIFHSLPRDVREQASLDGAGKRHLFWHIELPLAVSPLIDLFRVLWSVAWTTIIAAEMLGVQSGLGYRLLDFRYLLRYNDMLVYIVVIGGIGIATDYLLLHLKPKTG